MLSHLTGKVVAVSDGSIILDVHGVGFQIQVPKSKLFKEDSTITLSVYMYWNTETGPTLFGFASETEKSLFALIIGCSGIGSKIALTLLNHLSPALFIKAIQDNDEKVLSGVSGIGPKKAEQIIIQLRHKVAKLLDKGFVVEGSEDNSFQEWNNVIQVLQSLHYSKAEIDMTISVIRKEHIGPIQFDVIMRKALSLLSRI